MHDKGAFTEGHSRYTVGTLKSLCLSGPPCAALSQKLCLGFALVSRSLGIAPPSPPHADMPKSKSAYQHSEIADASVREIVVAGHVSWTHTRLVVINPLGAMPKPRSSKMGFIVDMRHVNKYIDVSKFVFEGLHSLKDLLSKVGWSSMWLNPEVRSYGII
jgi:hypothetical protein